MSLPTLIYRQADPFASRGQSLFRKRPGFVPPARPPRPRRPASEQTQPPQPDPAAPLEATRKRCGRCRARLARSAFHADRAQPDGIQGHCKLCRYDAETRKRFGREQREWWERIYRSTCGLCEKSYAGTHSRLCTACLCEFGGFAKQYEGRV